MKKTLSLVLSFVMLLVLCVPLTSCSDANTLVVCNWGEYMSTGADCDYDIVEEFEKGFKLGDKVIRYAMVKVAN